MMNCKFATMQVKLLTASELDPSVCFSIILDQVGNISRRLQRWKSISRDFLHILLVVLECFKLKVTKLKQW